MNSHTNCILALCLFLSSQVFALPIELFYFRVEKDGIRAMIEWQTIHEHNDEMFMVQHSTDGVEFHTIYTRAGSGTTSETNEYSHLDILAPGYNYYRLKQEDIDGNKSFSEIVLVKNFDLQQPEIMIYPNPTADIINIAGFHESFTTTVIDMQGNVLMNDHTLPAGQLNLQSLPSGLYTIIFSQGQNTFTKRIERL